MLSDSLARPENPKHENERDDQDEEWNEIEDDEESEVVTKYHNMQNV